MYDPITPVSKAAIWGPKRHSSAFDLLTKPIGVPKAYQPPRSLPVPVPKLALTAKITTRLLDMSLPRSPIVLVHDKESDYKVSTVTQAAMHAVASPRLEELATPRHHGK